MANHPETEAMLIRAIQHDNWLEFELALKQVTDLNKKMLDGLWPTAAALIYERNEMLKVLIEKGADTNYGGLIYDAVMNGRKEAVELLHENGADINVTGKYNVPPIYFAIQYDLYDMASYLLEHGAVIEDKDTMLEVSKSKEIKDLVRNFDATYQI